MADRQSRERAARNLAAAIDDMLDVMARSPGEDMEASFGPDWRETQANLEEVREALRGEIAGYERG